MKTISRRLLAVVLVPGLLLSACGKKDAGAPGSAGVEQSAPAIAGPFTGVLTMKTTMPNTGTSDSKLYIGPKGMRAESKASIPGQKGSVSIAVLSLADKPDTIYMINEAAGSCMALDVSKVKEQDTVEDPYEDAKIEKLGKERINGFDCNHVRISWADRESTIDLWVSKDILDYFAYARMQGSKDRKYERLAEKLKTAGLDGFPVKTLISPEGVVTELVTVERIIPDASLFEVPANCTKMEMPPVPSSPQGMSKEDVKKMQDWARKMQQQMKPE